MISKKGIISIVAATLIALSTITSCSTKRDSTLEKNKKEVTKASENNRNNEKVDIELEKATIVHHVDGDTTKVKLSNGKEEYVRFIGVNTPETVKKDTPVQPYGKEASEFTHSKLKEGTILWLQKDVGDKDNYGRLLRYVWLEKPVSNSEEEIKSKMLNAILIEQGYAQVMTVQPNVQNQSLFIGLQRDARNNNKGLWAIEPYHSEKSNSK